VPRRIVVLLAAAVLASCGDGDGRPSGQAPRAAPTTPAPPVVPGPDAAIPRAPAALAQRLTATTRRLRQAQARWDPADPVPEDVELLALDHQRCFRVLAESAARARAVVAQLPADVRGEVRDTAAARRALAAIPRAPSAQIPKLRVAAAEPAAVLERAYRRAQRRFGVRWTTLAAVNFVESAFGRVRSLSEAGARGPMQFLPATWAAYGLGGDIDDASDAILGAANLLRANGAPRDEPRALFAYNRSTSYVRAIRLFSDRMARDPRVFRTYYAWQVYARTPAGVRRLTGPGLGSTLRQPEAG
jgi:membrane-bound lytic murein transglycosylase B